MEAGPGEPTGRRNPGIGDRPLDERVSRPMAGRPSPTLETPRSSPPGVGVDPSPKHRRQEGGRLHIYLFREKTERIRVRQDRARNSARVPRAIPHGSPWQFRTGLILAFRAKRLMRARVIESERLSGPCDKPRRPAMSSLSALLPSRSNPPRKRSAENAAHAASRYDVRRRPAHERRWPSRFDLRDSEVRARCDSGRRSEIPQRSEATATESGVVVGFEPSF